MRCTVLSFKKKVAQAMLQFSFAHSVRFVENVKSNRSKPRRAHVDTVSTSMLISD